ncbi:MAG: tyrosine-type recombinase/integrase [Pseudomonadota bacterium]|nr:tyrosine-type recombinase/integrase [Pseudomonadota bacterium]
MKLTDTKIRTAKPRERPYKLFDGGGLYLLVAPQKDGSTGRYWRLKYRVRGKEKVLAIGVYPEIGLREAREARDDAKKLLVRGTDPGEKKRAGKIVQSDTFRLVAEEWLGLQARKLATVTLEKGRWMLETFIFPRLGDKLINDIKAPELLAALRAIESKGHHETATRTKQRVGQVMRYAIATGRAERDITADLRGALAPVPTKNRAAITDPAQVGELLRALDGYQGEPATAAALKLAPLTFVRPGELRGAEWREFDLDAAEWRIPGERMKMGDAHIVPLSTQAVAILRELHPLTGSGKLLFPSLRSRDRPMSENTLNAALRRLGYTTEQMTAHGFRAMASTLLNEQGFPPDVIELQLAHAERNKVRAAYNRAQRLEERRRMMQAWADYLDALRAGGKIVPIRRKA